MRLMIIGNLNGQLLAASRIAAARGVKVVHASEIDVALHILCSGKSVEMIMISSSMDIVDLVDKLQRARIAVQVIACGVNDNYEVAVNAIKSGAVEYLPLPPNEELIAAMFEKITNQNLNDEIICRSDALKKALDLAKKIAPSDASVLLTGASGTGKEVVARFIHKNSNRKNAEMIAVNCAAIPENLLESEMFGHEKGAFTGANERRIGKFEEANQGTILLDEISEMDIRLQAKLLRVLQEREITRVGSNKPIKLDIRVIATSNRDLLHRVQQKEFREDLFYRLNVINIKLPALKDRVEDIEILAEHFLSKYVQMNHLQSKNLTAEAVRKLCQYSWPGNVRELENMMHRAVLTTTESEISAEDILLYIEEKNECGTLASVEKHAIARAMSIYGANVDKAAAVLGISIKILKEKLQQHNITKLVD